jgi:ATP-dependent RNA helicase DHX36
MQDYQLPEMLRVGLEDLVLQILILDLGEPSSFLGRALNPPSQLSMRNSLKLLEELGAVECSWRDNDAAYGALKIEEPKAMVTEDEDGFLVKSCADMDVTSELTALGFHLATLPVDPRVGKMMIYGALFRCIDPALTIAASMSARNPFVSPFDKRDEADAARKKFAHDGSDHLSILVAFSQWKEKRQAQGERAAQNFVRDNFLSRQTLFHIDDLRKQFANLLVSIGFLPEGFRLNDATRRGERNSSGSGADDQDSNSDNGSNANADNMALVKAVLCAGLYPNIIVAPRSLVINSANNNDRGDNNKEAGEVAFQSLNKGDVYLHPCTIAFREKRLDSRYCCYHEMVKTSKTYVRDCTTVSPFALVLFGGTLQVYHEKAVVAVDEWLKFRIGRRPATLVKHLRTQMESMLFRKIVSPEDDVTDSPMGKALIQSISMLLQRDKAPSDTLRNDGAEIVRPWRGGNDNQRGNRGEDRARGGGRGRARGRGRGRGSKGGTGRR